MALDRAALLLACGLTALAPAQRPDDERERLAADFDTLVAPFLQDFCLACHADPDAAGKLDLQRYRTLEDVQRADVLWRYLGRRVQLEQMPPEGEYAPSAGERAAVTDWIDRALELRYDPELPPDPGRPVLRRLTRAQAERTLSQLFEVDLDAEALLPADGVALDFEGVGSAQHLPAAAVDGLLEFARTAAERAIVYDPHGWPGTIRYEAREMDPERKGRLSSRGEVGTRHDFGRAGSYRISFAAWADQAGPELARAALAVDGDPLVEFEVRPERGEEPQVHSIEIGVQSAGARRLGVQFVNDYYMPDAADPGQRDRNLAVVWLQIDGPFDPPSHPPLIADLVARHDLDLAGDPSRVQRHRALEDLATAVWRRPPGKGDLTRLVDLSKQAEPFGAGLRLALEAMLASSRFWFRVEADGDDAPAVRALDGYELASRLSFWLWSSGPDAELLELAADDRLADPEVLAAQVDRLLRDPRARAVAEEFVPQWLALDRLEERSRSAEDDGTDLVPSMLRETELLFEAILREGLPLITLLDADFTFVDEALAEHYGLAGVEGPFMRRVSLDGSGRRGILGHASVLTATSDPARTSPVLRGKWVLDSLLGVPPAPPPDDVPPLVATASSSPTTLRAQLELHRAAPTCAVCHDVMDPLGLALEGFGPTGRVRSFDGERPIDDLATLPDGRSVRGAGELVSVLVDDPRFLRTFVDRQMVFALGRALEAPDRGEVARIVADLDASTATVRDVVQAVARTHAFRFRRTIESESELREPRRPL